jgi:ribonuclease PH
MRVAHLEVSGLSGDKWKKETVMRPSGRKLNDMRPVSIEIGVMKHAEGSCLIKMGETHVLCSATIEDKAPPFLKNTGLGWVTAEYGMLPRATNSRTRREAAAGKQTGRTQEIQRLIGRALRAGVDRSALGERQIVVDCDVLQADGGTRCASITGGWVALRLAMNKLLKAGVIVSDPMIDHVAAISCGIYAGQPVLDLDYAEDSTAGTDGNFILTGRGRLIEVQMSAEGATFSRGEMGELLDLAETGAAGLVAAQKAALGLA